MIWRCLNSCEVDPREVNTPRCRKPRTLGQLARQVRMISVSMAGQNRAICTKGPLEALEPKAMSAEAEIVYLNYEHAKSICSRATNSIPTLRLDSTRRNMGTFSFYPDPELRVGI